MQSCLAGGQTTGYGSSQVEQDRTGGKPQTGPKPTEHGTVRRPGIPSREDSAGRDPDKTRPRTGTTGGDPNEMMYGPVGNATACTHQVHDCLCLQILHVACLQSVSSPSMNESNVEVLWKTPYIQCQMQTPIQLV